MYAKSKTALILKRLLVAFDAEKDLEEFRSVLRQDLIKAVRKILPSYFQGIKDIYACKQKAREMEALLLKCEADLEARNKFEGEEREESPHSLMFVMYLLAQHFLKVGDLDKALAYCSKAEDYCPTFVEVYMLKAKILRARFDYEAAAQTMADSQPIDKADRYLANKTAKYLLLNNQILEGDTMFKSFIYQSSNVEKSIHTLQKMFYEMWLGKAYIRQRKWARGLRQFKFVYQHICEISEDQLDFFQYMLRKTSLVPFVEVVKFNTESFKSDHRFVKGLGYFLRYGVRYRRNLPIQEAKIAEHLKKHPEEDEKKYRKALEKQERSGVVACDKEVAEELDLDGKKALDSLPLAQAAVLLSKTQTRDAALARVAYMSLFDYYFEQSRPLIIRKNAARSQVPPQARSPAPRRARRPRPQSAPVSPAYACLTQSKPKSSTRLLLACSRSSRKAS